MVIYASWTNERNKTATIAAVSPQQLPVKMSCCRQDIQQPDEGECLKNTKTVAELEYLAVITL